MSEGTATIGSCMAFSAAAPATSDQTGFEALTWTGSNEVTNIGDVGPENEVITFNTVCDGRVNKRLGAQNSGQQTLELAFDTGNAAQGILKDGADNKTIVSCRETLSTGDVLYYQAYVASFKTQPGGSSDFIRASVSLEVDGAIVQVDAA